MHEFETLLEHIGITTNIYLNQINLGIGMYLFTISALYKQDRMMHHGMRKPSELKIILYAAHMIKLNDYLDFTGSKPNNEICETEIIYIPLNSIPNSPA